jgi:hypothetical protein
MWLSYQHMTSVAGLAAARANIFVIFKSGNKIEENLKIFMEVDHLRSWGGPLPTLSDLSCGSQVI